jgi:hypothetical protein
MSGIVGFTIVARLALLRKNTLAPCPKVNPAANVFYRIAVSLAGPVAFGSIAATRRYRRFPNTMSLAVQ